jgi:transcriptional regulator with XRE-family HTH domain
VYSEEAHRFLIDAVRHRAKLNGLSIEELADEAGVSRGFLWEVLGGRSSPTVSTVCKLADALGCRPRLLLP